MKQTQQTFKDLQKIDIESILLSRMFFISPDNQHININPLNCMGHSMGALARTYVSYLIQNIFNIHRYPCCHETTRYSDSRKINEFFDDLEEKNYLEHLNELNRIYKHTQMQLLKISNTVRVRRGVKEPFVSIIACAVKYAIENGIDEVEVPCNTFDFYALAPACGFSDGVSFYRDIDIADILLCHQTVNGFHETDSDVLVINRSPRGTTLLKIEDIEIDSYVSVSDEQYKLYCDAIRSKRRTSTKAFEDFYAYMKHDSYNHVTVMHEELNWVGRFFSNISNKIGKKNTRMKSITLK